jgi:hypothetical protein
MWVLRTKLRFEFIEFSFRAVALIAALLRPMPVIGEKAEVFLAAASKHSLLFFPHFDQRFPVQLV